MSDCDKNLDVNIDKLSEAFDGVEARARLLEVAMASEKQEQERRARNEDGLERSIVAAERQAVALERIAERLDDMLDVLPRAILASGLSEYVSDTSVLHGGKHRGRVAQVADLQLAALLKHGAAK
jgi:hypothetical protein